MEANLHFVIDRVDGTQFTQDVTVPADKTEAAMQQLLIQYSQVGVLKKDGEKYTLTPSSQIAQVECELPSLVVAGPSETSRAAQAAGSLKKLTLV